MHESVEVVWGRIRERLKDVVSPDIFARWIAVIQPLSLTQGRLVLGVANDFYILWLTENYLPLIRRVAADETTDITDILFEVSEKAETPAEDIPPAPVLERNGPRRKTPPPALCPAFTFDSFVVGPSNSFSHAACLAVAQRPACAYNPLLVYGGPGLGKTHLIQAIGHHVFASSPASRICYLSAESFLNEYIESLHNNRSTDFRKKYRGVDVLLLDDVHFLAGKDGIQEEFFNTFNALFYARKQIVLTCDRPISEIEGLEPRLVSRFGWGLVAELSPPDLETRAAILRKKADILQVSVPNDVMLYIAENIRYDMRKLEGALIRVVSYTSLLRQPATIEIARRLLRDSVDSVARVPSCEVIQRAVAEAFDLRLADMTSKRRPQAVALPRQIAMYLCRRLTDRSLPSIGDAFGRNHATVIHACRTVESRMRTDSSLREAVERLQEKISRG